MGHNLRPLVKCQCGKGTASSPAPGVRQAQLNTGISYQGPIQYMLYLQVQCLQNSSNKDSPLAFPPLFTRIYSKNFIKNRDFSHLLNIAFHWTKDLQLWYRNGTTHTLIPRVPQGNSVAKKSSYEDSVGKLALHPLCTPVTLHGGARAPASLGCTHAGRAATSSQSRPSSHSPATPGPQVLSPVSP